MFVTSGATAVAATAVTSESPAAVAVATPSTTALSDSTALFDDTEWEIELEGVEVQELDETWRGVTIFRHVIERERVCMWFGEDEYEGIDKDKPYRYCSQSEVLEDDEGEDINWRMQSEDNDDDDDDDYS